MSPLLERGVCVRERGIVAWRHVGTWDLSGWNIQEAKDMWCDGEGFRVSCLFQMKQQQPGSTTFAVAPPLYFHLIKACGFLLLATLKYAGGPLINPHHFNFWDLIPGLGYSLQLQHSTQRGEWKRNTVPIKTLYSHLTIPYIFIFAQLFITSVPNGLHFDIELLS